MAHAGHRAYKKVDQRTVPVILVKNDDILENDCNLSVSSYVEQEDTREVINIAEVNAKLETLVKEGNELNQKIEAIIKELEQK